MCYQRCKGDVIKRWDADFSISLLSPTPEHIATHRYNGKKARRGDLVKPDEKYVA